MVNVRSTTQVEGQPRDGLYYPTDTVPRQYRQAAQVIAIARIGGTAQLQRGPGMS